jgi:hypothetical protein
MVYRMRECMCCKIPFRMQPEAALGKPAEGYGFNICFGKGHGLVG